MLPLKRHYRDSFILMDHDYNVIDWNPTPGVPAIWAQLELKSVQHTGTNFLNKVLTDAGWTVRATHWAAKNLYDKPFTISPIRNPWDTYVTWISRRRNDSYLGQWLLFNAAFEALDDLYIVPVDTEDRDYYLNLLSQRLKCELTTDWKPVESQRRIPVEKTNYVRQILHRVYQLPVVKKFYRQP